MTGRGKEKKREEVLMVKADAATEAASKPSAYEQYQQPKDIKFLQDLESGTDVKDIDAVRWQYDLFNNAKQDPELQGEGLFSNNLLRGGNANQMGLISQQIQARQQQQNQGNLYGAVQGARGEAMDRSQGFSNASDRRNLGAAGLANDRYTAYLQRPKKPSLWE